MENLITQFASEVARGKIEIYNEFSLQHELGIFLRSNISDKKIQFERNVSFFGLDKIEYVKREIDISVFSNITAPDAAIELKYPRNGQHPEQMYSFCQDIEFMEQLKASGFVATYGVIFAEDHLFYEGNQEGIYGFFRGGRNLSGKITKPTGKKDTEVKIKGSYTVTWHPVVGNLKYTIIKAQ